MDWTPAESQLVPLLRHPDRWPGIREKLEKRKVTRLLPVYGEDGRPSAIQADSQESGWRIAGIEWEADEDDPVARAFTRLLRELDTPGGTQK